MLREIFVSGPAWKGDKTKKGRSLPRAARTDCERIPVGAKVFFTGILCVFQEKMTKLRLALPARRRRRMGKRSSKTKNSHRFPCGSLPLVPCRPSYNLHEWAGGSPKFCFAASNIRPRKAGRPAIRRLKSASLIDDVGLMGRARPDFGNARAQQDFFAADPFYAVAGRIYDSSSSSSNRMRMNCSYTSLSSSSSSIVSKTSSPFSSTALRSSTRP